MKRLPTWKEVAVILAAITGWTSSYLQHRERMAEMQLRYNAEHKLEVKEYFNRKMSKELYE